MAFELHNFLSMFNPFKSLCKYLRTIRFFHFFQSLAEFSDCGFSFSGVQ